MDTAISKLLREEYRLAQKAIEQRLAEFAAIPQEKYFYELVYCLLTPQSSAVHALDAQRTLTDLDFQHRPFDPESILRRPQAYIRFHKTKASHLLTMKERFSTIDSVVVGALDVSDKRKWLADNVLGLSYKESTHFLRNIGKNESLAILDRHILKHLQRHKVIAEIPRTLTKKKYLEIEKAFQEFAEEIDIPINALDLLFWSSETGVILK
jgi:N-glycosylase/DNA lyase